MSGLLEATYSVPSAGESSFMKFVKGENRFRILDRPTLGYQYWQDDKTPVRIKKAGDAPNLLQNLDSFPAQDPFHAGCMTTTLVQDDCATTYSKLDATVK